MDNDNKSQAHSLPLTVGASPKLTKRLDDKNYYQQQQQLQQPTMTMTCFNLVDAVDFHHHRRRCR
jgi:hypothetical protein